MQDKEYYRQWREKNRESYNTRMREYMRQHPSYWRDTQARIKSEVLTYYGGGEPACVGCGFSDIRALTIDHINGGGRQHKQALGKYGINFYRWLIQQGFPEGYQTFCMNCQFIKVCTNNECRGEH